MALERREMSSERVRLSQSMSSAPSSHLQSPTLYAQLTLDKA